MDAHEQLLLDPTAQAFNGTSTDLFKQEDDFGYAGFSRYPWTTKLPEKSLRPVVVLVVPIEQCNEIACVNDCATVHNPRAAFDLKRGRLGPALPRY